MIRRFLPCLCLLVPLACAGNPQRPCTEMGCGPAVHIAFQKGEPWIQGAYTFTATLDGQAHTCTVTMPQDCNAPASCSSPNLMLLQEGCALPYEQQTISGLDIVDASPGTIKIDVGLNSALLGQGVFTPNYEDLRPNGPDCEPTCRQSRDQLTLRIF